MRTKLPLAAIMSRLPDEIQGPLSELVPDPETATVHRKAAMDTSKPLDPEKRECLQYVSTRDIDREGEIVDPDGLALKEFRLAPQVLWGHDYSLPPIGRDTHIASDGYGVLARTQYADTELALDCWNLRKGGFLNTASIGFISTDRVRNGEDGWAKLVERLAKKWSLEPSAFEACNCVITKSLLLEHSDVSVPANIYARTVDVAKGKSDMVLEGRRLQEVAIKGGLHAAGLKWDLLRTARALMEPAGAYLTEYDGEPDTIELDAGVIVLDPEKGEPWSYKEADAKPFANEHACRLRDPDDFEADSFRRYGRQSDGRKYSIISGKLKGGDGSMVEQAFRYPKDKWPVADAKKHCKAHEGMAFEPAKENERVMIRVVRKPSTVIREIDPAELQRVVRSVLLAERGELDP